MSAARRCYDIDVKIPTHRAPLPASVDRAQGSGGRTAHSVHGFGRGLVGGEEDDQLLAVGGGEFEHFTVEPELAEIRVTPCLGAAGTRAMVVEAFRELCAGQRGDLGDERARTPRRH